MLHKPSVDRIRYNDASMRSIRPFSLVSIVILIRFQVACVPIHENNGVMHPNWNVTKGFAPARVKAGWTGPTRSALSRSTNPTSTSSLDVAADQFLVPWPPSDPWFSVHHFRHQFRVWRVNDFWNFLLIYSGGSFSSSR